eukprot:361145-Chlamydomonas_euryale.AAC.3
MKHASLGVPSNNFTTSLRPLVAGERCAGCQTELLHLDQSTCTREAKKGPGCKECARVEGVELSALAWVSLRARARAKKGNGDEIWACTMSWASMADGMYPPATKRAHTPHPARPTPHAPSPR